LDGVPDNARSRFLAALEQWVLVARKDAGNLGLMLIDLVNLGSINHCHGYEVGDQLLATSMNNLLGISKLPDTVFRVGDHRFAFILPALGNPAFIALALSRVESVLAEKRQLGSQLIAPDVKVGVAINRHGDHNALATLALAENSLDLVKAGRRLRIEELLEAHNAPPRDYQLESRFEEALYNNDFELHFQPKVNLISGRVDKAEALIRWTPDGREPVSPELVVELADTSGRAFKLAKWLIHVALRQLSEWQGSIDVALALNIQAGLVGDAELPALFKDAIAVWGASPHKITVEITESALIEDRDSGFENLSRLRDLGVNLSIDDFGTGYSSLSYFKYVPADELKIDRSFIAGMMANEQDMELVKIMIRIARKFGLSIVAEGVEDEDSVEVLRRLGCDYAQGYYFSQPLPRKEFEAWVTAWPGLTASS
jgi:diguanylate cyclase (GGDEF)-like protein